MSSLWIVRSGKRAWEKCPSHAQRQARAAHKDEIRAYFGNKGQLGADGKGACGNGNLPSTGLRRRASARQVLLQKRICASRAVDNNLPPSVRLIRPVRILQGESWLVAGCQAEIDVITEPSVVCQFEKLCNPWELPRVQALSTDSSIEEPLEKLVFTVDVPEALV